MVAESMNTSSSLATLTSSDAVLSAYAPDPNPAEAFTAWLAIEFGDPAVRPTLEISIELDAALVAAFDGVQIGAPFENRLDATSSLVGNVLTVSVSDDGGSPFLGYEVRHDGFLALHFNGVSAGQHEIDLQSVDAEDSQGVPLSLNWQLSDVVVDVATAQITTSEFDVAHSSENYVGILEASHFPVGPVTWTLDSGQLPAGLTLSESGVVFGVVDAGTSGSFGFTARATGADGTAATRAL